MYEFGQFILNILSKLRQNEIVKALFLKTFVMSFSLLILPSLLIYLFFAVRSVLLVFIWEIVEPLIDAVIPTTVSVQISGLGAFILNHMRGVEALMIVLSASLTAFAIRFVRK